MRNSVSVAAFILFMAAASPAFAYIDPGSGSVLATAVIGFFAAIGYTARKYFYRAKDAVLARFRKKAEK